MTSAKKHNLRARTGRFAAECDRCGCPAGCACDGDCGCGITKPAKVARDAAACPQCFDAGTISGGARRCPRCHDRAEAGQ